MSHTKVDYHKEAMTLIESLKREGRSASALILQEALDEAGTGTEMAMALRWQLRRMSGEMPEWSETTRSRAVRLLAHLDHLLSA